MHETAALAPIKNETIRHPHWASRVSAEYHHNLYQDALAHNPVRRLLLFKNAIRSVSDNIQHQGAQRLTTTRSAQNTQDKLSATMAFIRAAEHSNLNLMQKHAEKSTPISRHW